MLLLQFLGREASEAVRLYERAVEEVGAPTVSSEYGMGFLLLATSV